MMRGIRHARPLALLLVLGALTNAIAQVKTPDWIPIREILAGRKTDQLVYVEGTSGALVAEGSTQNTRLYRLSDVFNDSIRVRTSDLDFQKGTSYGVRGTVMRQGGEYILVEDVRASIARVREGGSKVAFDRKIGNDATGATEKAESGSTSTEKADKKDSSSKAEPDVSEEESSWRNPLVLGGAAGVALLIILGLVVSGQNRKKQEASRRQRERELEEERLRRERERGSVVRPPTEVASGGAAAGAASKVREATVQSWGTIKVESGPGKIVGGGHLIGAYSIIGREEGQIVIENDRLISGKAEGHGKILLAADGRATFVDNSTNGSKVNGKPVHHGQVELSSGDTIEIGQTVVSFEKNRQSGTSAAEGSVSRAPTQTFAAPSSQATGVFTGAKLSIVGGPGSGKDFSLLQSITRIGRASGQDIELDDTTASREHSEIEVRDGKLFLKNLSQNGTTLGSAILRERGAELEIRDGDEFQMGATRMKLAAGAAAKEE